MESDFVYTMLCLNHELMSESALYGLGTKLQERLKKISPLATMLHEEAHKKGNENQKC